MIARGRRLVATAVATMFAATALAGAAQAAQLAPIHFEPVTLAGTTYTGAGGGELSRLYPGGYDTSKAVGANPYAEATLPKDYGFGKAVPWGSVGAVNGSFIQNQTGKPICKITISSTNGDTFDPKSTAGGKWTVTVDNTAKPPTITFEAKNKPADCIPDKGYFWMMVPKLPQPPKATLEGQLAILDPAAPPSTPTVLTDAPTMTAEVYATDVPAVAPAPSVAALA